MLEFIVLGQIPGTNIYLSFTAVIILAVVAIITKTSVTVKRHIHEYHKQLAIEAKTI